MFTYWSDGSKILKVCSLKCLHYITVRLEILVHTAKAFRFIMHNGLKSEIRHARLCSLASLERAVCAQSGADTCCGQAAVSDTLRLR